MPSDISTPDNAELLPASEKTSQSPELNLLGLFENKTPSQTSDKKSELAEPQKNDAPPTNTGFLSFPSPYENDKFATRKAANSSNPESNGSIPQEESGRNLEPSRKNPKAGTGADANAPQGMPTPTPIENATETLPRISDFKTTSQANGKEGNDKVYEGLHKLLNDTSSPFAEKAREQIVAALMTNLADPQSPAIGAEKILDKPRNH